MTSMMLYTADSLQIHVFIVFSSAGCAIHIYSSNVVCVSVWTVLDVNQVGRNCNRCT